MTSPRPCAPATDSNALVESHLYLVQHVVNQLASRYPRHVDRQELWSAGAAGLVDASRRYDPSTGVPFARYATIRIRGAIVDSTRTRDWATRRLRRDLRTMASHTQRFEEEHGRMPNDGELAGALGVEVEEVAERKAAALTATLLHLDQPLPYPGAGEGTLGESIADPHDDRLPDNALERQELRGTLRTALALLPPVQRDVLQRYFFGDELLRDIAESLGVTEARVSQIRSEALNAVRAYFATMFDDVPAVPSDAPGVRQRAAYVASMAARNNWRTRLDAGAPAALVTSAETV
jgi:RNA polymerase sigma factor for flagellar operon FliA